MDFTRPPLCCCCCGGPHLNGNCETYSYCDRCGLDLVYCSCEPDMVLIPGSFPLMAQPETLEEPDEMVVIDEVYPWMAQPEILEEPDEMVVIDESYPWLAEDWLPVGQSQNQSIQPQLEQEYFKVGSQLNEDCEPSDTSDSKLEEALTQFMQMTKTTFLSQDQAMKNMERNHEASIKKLETLIGQLSKQLAELSSSGFSANTTDNPKHETAEAISLRSGRELKTPEVDCEKRVLVENERSELSEKNENEKNGEVENELSEKNEGVEKSNNLFVNEKLQVAEKPKADPSYMKLPYHPQKKKREKEDKDEIDRVIDSICALFTRVQLEETWKPYHLFLKFMEFLPNKLKKLDDVLAVSFWPP